MAMSPAREHQISEDTFSKLDSMKGKFHMTWTSYEKKKLAQFFTVEPIYPYLRVRGYVTIHVKEVDAFSIKVI